MHFTINGVGICIYSAWVWVCISRVRGTALTHSGAEEHLHETLVLRRLLNRVTEKIRLINYTEGLVGAGEVQMYFCSALKYFPGLVVIIIILIFFFFNGTLLLWLEAKEPDRLAGSCLPGKKCCQAVVDSRADPASALACSCPDAAGFWGAGGFGLASGFVRFGVVVLPSPPSPPKKKPKPKKRLLQQGAAALLKLQEALVRRLFLLN